MLSDFFINISVIGAAGKMGSGISLLLLQEMARIEAEQTGFAENKRVLQLIDSNWEGLVAVKSYLRDHLIKYAEKNINRLREYFALNTALISNQEMIEFFVEKGMDLIHLDLDTKKAALSDLIFEAIVEDVEIKSKVLNEIENFSDKTKFFFSNTSSIPIQILNEKGDLRNRVIGFHFYNPPAVQKLVELIEPKGIDPLLVNLANDLAKQLNKIVVRSADVAGFIGNGFFIRETIFAFEKVRLLSRTYSLKDSIYIVNKVTQDFLIRPMGIFQLIDYVGIDVCQKICAIMNLYLPNVLFQDPLLEALTQEGITGGQYPDGSQKNGFFEYNKNERSGIYDPNEQHYSPLAADQGLPPLDKVLGAYPNEHGSWKHLQKDPQKNEKLKVYLHNLLEEKTLGAELAKEFLKNDFEVAQNLVMQGVAKNLEDVSTVLKNGFFHLYGPEIPR